MLQRYRLRVKMIQTIYETIYASDEDAAIENLMEQYREELDAGAELWIRNVR